MAGETCFSSWASLKSTVHRKSTFCIVDCPLLATAIADKLNRQLSWAMCYFKQMLMVECQTQVWWMPPAIARYSRYAGLGLKTVDICGIFHQVYGDFCTSSLVIFKSTLWLCQLMCLGQWPSLGHVHGLIFPKSPSTYILHALLLPLPESS